MHPKHMNMKGLDPPRRFYIWCHELNGHKFFNSWQCQKSAIRKKVSHHTFWKRDIKPLTLPSTHKGTA